HAQGQTGSELLTKCKDFFNILDNNSSGFDAFGGGFCAGFVSGVLSGAEVWKVADTLRKQDHPMAFCRPEKSDNGQLVRVFVKYLEDHPEKLHEPAGVLLLASLTNAFP